MSNIPTRCRNASQIDISVPHFQLFVRRTYFAAVRTKSQIAGLCTEVSPCRSFPTETLRNDAYLTFNNVPICSEVPTAYKVNRWMRHGMRTYRVTRVRTLTESILLLVQLHLVPKMSQPHANARELSVHHYRYSLDFSRRSLSNNFPSPSHTLYRVQAVKTEFVVDSPCQ